jgi:flagellar basal-body rod protein FlgC
MPDSIRLAPSRLFAGVDIAASAMSAERLRMTVASENLAHAGDTRRLADGMPYQRQRVQFQEALDAQGAATGLVQSQAVASPKYEGRYDPSHPDANAEGIVHTPEVSSVLELTDLMTASKAYEANANAARGLLRMHENALRLGQD